MRIKKIMWIAGGVLVLGGAAYAIFFRGNDAADAIQTDTVKIQDVRRTVLTTGQVVSSVDLDLGFKASGVVKRVTVKEGDAVSSGQVLAILDQTDALANLTSAQGSLAQAKANYERVLAGASSEAIAVTQKAVDAAEVALVNAQTSLANTQAQQDTAVKNAYAALLNTSFSAIPSSNNTDQNIPTISGTYTGMQEGSYQIKLDPSGNGQKFQTTGLEAFAGDVKTITPVALGTRGLYIQFSTFPAITDSWTIYIPNTYASAYVANNNAYQAALKARDTAVANAQAQLTNAQTALAQAQANLDVQRAQARPADIAAANAQILSAQGQVEIAQAAVDNTTLRAPADGTITQVDIKVGEQATALKEAVVLQDIGSLHAEANVSEASIAAIMPGQSVDFTFDALGPDRHFEGKVQTINPASVVISGVVNYKVTASFAGAPEIKPGMTTNMTVLIAKKDEVLAVPQRAIINQDGKQYARVIDDAKKKTYHQVEVQTGIQADGGLVEIVSGLSQGQEIVTFIKK